MGRAQELLDAAREGDKKTVEKIVGQINKRSGPFTSLRRTPGVNVHDDNGYTPLHHACLNGHKNAVEILLSADASPCIVDKKGATPLHLAAFNGCPDVVRMLLAHNAPPVNLDQLTLMHETALMIAAQFGHVEVVRQLIRRDADVTIRNKKGESALDLAAQYGRLATVKLLIQLKPELIDMYRMPIREGTIFPSTPLHRASKYGRKEVVEALLAAGIDPNIRTENGTPLHEAACFARASVVRLLLEKGADIKAKGKKGKTVHELLAERPEDETRNVREAIKDFLSHRNSYDSEEDCPPFPVYGWLQSPTALAHQTKFELFSRVSRSTPEPAMLASPKDNVVTNAPNTSPTRDEYEIESDFDSDRIVKTDSFLTSTQYLEKIISDQGKSGTALIKKHCEVMSELKSFNYVTSKNNPKVEVEKKIKKNNVFNKIVTKWSDWNREAVARHKEITDILKQNVVKHKMNTEVNTFQSYTELPRKPTPPPKPRKLSYNIYQNSEAISSLDISSSSVTDFCDGPIDNLYVDNENHYLPMNQIKTSKINITVEEFSDCQVEPVYDKISSENSGQQEIVETTETYYENLTLRKQNLPDDEKVILTNNINNFKNITSYQSMTPIFKDRNSRSCEYVNVTQELNKLISCPRSKSVPNVLENLNRRPSMHIKGQPGCMFHSYDKEYIYALHPNAFKDNVKPFIKRKVSETPMPCYCRNISNFDKQIHASNGLMFRSVIDNLGDSIYCSLDGLNNDEENKLKREKFHRFENTSNSSELHNQNDSSGFVRRLTGVWKKKMDQIKVLVTDWTTPETQKMSNKNESLLSTSSLTNKNHPQSFVKKLASKCLGLKAKFNSAPNISNNSDTEADVSDKKKVQISNSNTLHTGNSKFFNMFSKREESGEIICTNEFDTISLDRHETLNRDSVVNRSNRSCPGFKTSLPNISENNELSDHDSVAGSMVNIESSCDRHDEVKKINEAVNTHLDIFEPRERASVISNTSVTSAILVNEYYESFEFRDKNTAKQSESLPRPLPRPNVHKESMIYENVSILKIKPTPAARTHIPTKPILDESENKVLYENIVPRQKPDPPKRSFLPPKSQSESFDKSSSPSISRSSTLSSDSMIDESNLEDILLSKKSKSFRQGKITSYYSGSYKSDICRTQSNASDSSDITEISAIDNVDCSDDVVDPKSIYLSMTGTLPNKKTNTEEKKILFRHKTFTNIEVDRNSVKVRDLPQWNREFLKETLPNYHIRGTGHCIYSAPTVEEFIYVFNRDTLYKDVPPFTKVPNDKHDSYFETAICFCKPRPPKHHNSAEDLLERIHQDDSEKVSIDIEALKNRREICQTSFICFCDSGTCKFHSNRREISNDLVVKFSAINKSMSTPDITLEYSPSSTTSKSHLTKINSVPYFEEPYAVVSIEDSLKKCEPDKVNDEQIYTPMSRPSTMSSTSSNRLYSLKDISDVISINDHTSAASTLTNDVHLPVRKSSSSEYSGQWSLQSCNSNVTIKSDLSYKTCLEESSDDSDGTLHSDDESEAETIKSDISTAKRPWVHSDSFRFGSNANIDIDTIAEENSFDDSKYESMSSKFESGISVEGSESSSSGGEDDSGIPRGEGVSLDCASLERGSVAGGVRSGSGRRRWDEIEGTSEGDALSVSSAASSCAPLHFAHHHEYSKVSPTPPKKPPRRNLSVSPTHANSPSSGYSYELRVHARSQDDLDDIQGTNKHYLKHGRSVDHYVDSKLSYSEYEENHNSPRVIPIPNPRTSLKQRSQPVAINATYENVVIKEQNPRRKLKRNSFAPSENYERMNERRKYTHQERSSLESLLDDQSVNSPSDCERYYDGPRSDIPLSPTHYEQPPTPDHPPPSAKQAEKSIHERIRPLSQEYKRRSMLRDSQTETEVNLLRAASAASVASGATDRSGNTDNCVEEYVCDVPFAGLFKGSTTTLDGIGLRPMPAERPKSLRKLKSVYDSSPTEQHLNNGQDRLNGVEDEIRRRSNTTSSNQSGDKSLSILSPFDEQEEWAKISEIMASFGSKLVRESVFVSELEQEFTSRLGLSCSESSLSPSVASNLGLWLTSIGLHDYETLFLESGYDDIDFINGVLNENDLREMGIEENDRHKILESSKQLPLKIAEISNNHNNNNISKKKQNESVDEWLRNINLEQYSDTFRKHLYVDMDRVKRIWEVELTAVLEIQKAGHRKRILASVSGEQNGPLNNVEDINSDLNSLKNNIQQLKEEIKEKLPHNENLKPVPPPVVPTLAPPGGETLKRSKKNRPAPQPPRPSDLEIRAPSELLVGVPGALKTQWKHQPFVLVTGAVTYVANYLGSTVVKELRGTESTKKSIQKLKKSTKEPRDSPDIILSISYRGVKFLNTITRELVCEHEIRNIHCACQDADDLTHFAYITKDHATKSHFCHVFRVATMDQATEVILTLGEAFEVAYQMALREQANRAKIPQPVAKTPTHDPMTTSNREKPNINHGRSHSITEIKLNGHQLKIAPIPASLSNEDFQAAARASDGSKSPKTPLLKAPIASTEEL